MDSIIDYYLSKEEKEEFLNIINSIYTHNEFIRRNTKEFLHHADVTLGKHIIEVACLTYKKAKKKKNIKIDLAVKIAIMHDLYELPWQNNEEARVNHFYNKHGFKHPLEACINSIIWFNDSFDNDENAKIIIDGIIHHMYPLPVRACTKNENDMELKNSNNFKKLDNKYKNMIIESTSRKKIGHYSICKSRYKEGRLVSKCDKIVSFSQIKNINSLLALITGKNKSI